MTVFDNGTTHLCVKRAEVDEDKITVTAGQFLTPEQSKTLYEALRKVHAPSAGEVNVIINVDTRAAEDAISAAVDAFRETDGSIHEIDPDESPLLTAIMREVEDSIGAEAVLPILPSPAANEALARLVSREMRQ